MYCVIRHLDWDVTTNFEDDGLSILSLNKQRNKFWFLLFVYMFTCLQVLRFIDLAFKKGEVVNVWVDGRFGWAF